MKCLVSGCDRIALSRGLCQACYLTARNHVNNGKTTWSELEGLGIAKPPTRRGCNGVSPVTAMLLKARAAEAAAEPVSSWFSKTSMPPAEPMAEPTGYCVICGKDGQLDRNGECGVCQN